MWPSSMQAPGDNEQAACQPQNPTLVTVWLSPSSFSGQRGQTGACSHPHSHSQALISADATGASLSAPAGLGVPAVCMSGRKYRENLGEPLMGAGGPKAGFVQPCLPCQLPPRHRIPGALPDPQGPFHPAPPPACLSSQAPCTPCIPASRAFPDLSILQAPLLGPPPWPPCCCFRSLSPHCMPGPIPRTYIPSPAALGRGNAKPLLQMDKQRLESQVIAHEIIHEMRVQIL